VVSLALGDVVVEVVPDFIVNTSCLRAACAITAGNMVDESSTAAAMSASRTASNAISCVIKSRDSSSEMNLILRSCNPGGVFVLRDGK
jgi:hypothetical protein